PFESRKDECCLYNIAVIYKGSTANYESQLPLLQHLMDITQFARRNYAVNRNLEVGIDTQNPERSGIYLYIKKPEEKVASVQQTKQSAEIQKSLEEQTRFRVKFPLTALEQASLLAEKAYESLPSKERITQIMGTLKSYGST